MRARGELIPAADVTEQVARDACALRRRHVRVRDGICPERDFQAFWQHLRMPQSTLALLRDPSGEVRGMLHFASLRRVWEGRRIAVAMPEYAFVDGARAGGWLGLTMARFCIQFALRNLGRAQYVANPSYLPSYLAYRRWVSTVWILGDAQAPPAASRLMNELAGVLAGDGFRPDSGLVRLNTQPRDPRERTPRRPETKRAFAHYMACNPDWAEGWAVLMLIPTGPRHVARSVLGPVWRGLGGEALAQAVRAACMATKPSIRRTSP